MAINASKTSEKIIYSSSIAGLYVVLNFAQSNPLISFILTLNIFYFTREALFNYLFKIKDINLPISEENSNILARIPVKESKVLPKNIKNIIKASSTISTSSKQQTEENTSSLNEEILIKALKKAETLVDQKIDLLRSKQPIVEHTKHSELKNSSKKEKLPSLKEKEAVKVQWETWGPSFENERIITQGIYCEKCKKLYSIQETDFKITKHQSYFEVVSTHEMGSERHTNTARMANESYEILSKPILTVQKSVEVVA